LKLLEVKQINTESSFRDKLSNYPLSGELL